MLLVVAAFGALSVAVVPWVVIAATQTWTGGGAVGSGWASPNNWNSSAGPSPSNGDDVVLAQVQGNPPNNFDINETMPARRGTSAGRDACAPRPKQCLASALQWVASFDDERLAFSRRLWSMCSD